MDGPLSNICPANLKKNLETNNEKKMLYLGLDFLISTGFESDTVEKYDILGLWK